MGLFKTPEEIRAAQAKRSTGDFAVTNDALGLKKNGMSAKFLFLDDLPKSEEDKGVAFFYEHRIYNNKFMMCIPCFEDDDPGSCPICAAGGEHSKKSLRYITNIFLLELKLEQDGQRIDCNMSGDAFSKDDWKFEDRVKVLVEGGETDGQLLWSHGDDGGTLLGRVYTYRRYKAERVKYALERGDKIDKEGQFTDEFFQKVGEIKYDLIKFLHERRVKGLADWQTHTGTAASIQAPQQEAQRPMAKMGANETAPSIAETPAEDSSDDFSKFGF